MPATLRSLNSSQSHGRSTSAGFFEDTGKPPATVNTFSFGAENERTVNQCNPPPKKNVQNQHMDQLIQTSLTKITSPTNMLLKFLRLMNHVQCIAVVCLVKSDQLKICSKHLLRMKAFEPRKIPVNTKPQKVFWMFTPYNKCPLDDILGSSHRPPTVMIYHHIRDPHYLKNNII